MTTRHPPPPTLFSNNNNNDDDLISGPSHHHPNNNNSNSNNGSVVLLQGSVVPQQPKNSTSKIVLNADHGRKSVIPAGTSEETLRTLCVRLVKDKMSLEKRISDLQNELVKESKIVTDLQTKFAALASTTVVVERIQQYQPIHHQNNNNSNNITTPTPKPHQSHKKKNDDDDDDDSATNHPSKPITPPPSSKSPAATNLDQQHGVGSGGVSGFFKSVLDKATALPNLSAAAIKPSSPEHSAANANATAGYQARSVAEWSQQCDDLLSLNEELHMQLFDIKHEHDTKLKEAQRSNSKRETQLLAEVNSLREQLAITQDNYVTQTRRVAEQEIVSRQAEGAMRQFRWISDRVSSLEKRNGTRFGYSEGLARRNQVHNSNSNNNMKMELFVGNKWKAASRAFANVLEAMIRKIENPTSVSSSSATSSSSHRNMTTSSKIAFQLQTLLQQWSNLEDIHSQVGCNHDDDDDENDNGNNKKNNDTFVLLLPALHRTRASMIHVIRNCSIYVIPILMKQASLCFLEQNGRKQQRTANDIGGGIDESLLIASSPEVVSCVTSSLQDCCDALSSWLAQVNQEELSGSNKRNDVLMILPSFSRLPIERFAEWLSLIAGTNRKEKHENRAKNDDDENDSRTEEEKSSKFSKSSVHQDHFLGIIDHLAIALKELPFDNNNNNNFNTHEEDPERSNRKGVNSSTSPLPATQIAQKLLCQADPQQIFLSGRRQNDNNYENDNEEQEFLNHVIVKMRKIQTKQKNNNKIQQHRQTPRHEVDDAFSLHLQLLLRQALLDCDALVVQKEQLLLEKRDLAVRCDTLGESNRALAGEMARRDFDHQDTVDTLHRQIEILSEALTESQMVGSNTKEDDDGSDDGHPQENSDIVNATKKKRKEREMLLGIGREDEGGDEEEL